MQTSEALAGIAVSTVDLANQRLRPGFYLNASSDRIPVGFNPDQFELNPVSSRLGLVMIEEGGLVGVGLIDVEAPVVIEISDADSAAIEVVVHAGLRGNLLERP